MANLGGRKAKGGSGRAEGGMDGMAAGRGGFPIHLGSTGCRAAAGSQKPTECLYPNTARVGFDRFDPAGDTVVADLSALLAGVDLSRNRPKTAPGCMSEPEDGDCAPIMEHLGIGFGGKPAATQTFFRVER